MGDIPYEGLNCVGADFLLADLALAMTFMDIAESSEADETIRRNHKNARKAYDSTHHLFSKLTLNRKTQEAIEAKLTLLKERLKSAGEQF
jgi:hypothetical protein